MMTTLIVTLTARKAIEARCAAAFDDPIESVRADF